MILVPANDMGAHLRAAFEAYGAPPQTAAEVADHLIEASLTGHDSHGVLRAPWYMEKISAGELIPDATVEVERETASSAVVDGNWGFGQPASRRAMTLCIEKARTAVVACVTVKHANHMGRVGLFTSMAADQGMIGMGAANLHGASPCVAPFGGIDRRLATNPFSIAYPSGLDGAFLLDMTTSVVAEGKLQLRRNRAQPVEPGWIIDHEGRPSTDPKDFYEPPQGALQPLGAAQGYKGFGLSLAVEALAGALSGTTCSHPAARRHGNACWYLAIRIDAFTALDAFRENVDAMFGHMKSARPAGPGAEVLIPGEPERRARAARLADGIPVDPHTWAWLERMSAAVGVRYTGPQRQAPDAGS